MDKLFKKFMLVLTFIHVYIVVLNRIVYGILEFIVNVLGMESLDIKLYWIKYDIDFFYLDLVYIKPGLLPCILIITAFWLLCFGLHWVVTGKIDDRLFFTGLAVNVLLPVAAVIRLAFEFAMS